MGATSSYETGSCNSCERQDDVRDGFSLGDVRKELDALENERFVTWTLRRRTQPVAGQPSCGRAKSVLVADVA
jgi:hypothetical protein